MSSTGEKIDPRVVRTRKLLIDALASLLAEKQFEEISVQDITQRATVNRATFYAHFPDKYAMIDEMIRLKFARSLEQRMASQVVCARDHLRRLFLAVTDHWSAMHSHCGETYQLFEALVEAQVKTQVRASVRAWLLGHDGPAIRRPECVEMASAIVSWAIYGAAMEWSRRTDGQTAEEFADLAIPLIAASITALDTPSHR
jgi:AcrR family transcriptional regulator